MLDWSGRGPTGRVYHPVVRRQTIHRRPIRCALCSEAKAPLAQVTSMGRYGDTLGSADALQPDLALNEILYCGQSDCGQLDGSHHHGTCVNVKHHPSAAENLWVGISSSDHGNARGLPLWSGGLEIGDRMARSELGA